MRYALATVSLFTLTLFGTAVLLDEEETNSIFHGELSQLTLGETELTIAIADTPHERQQGLSDLLKLPSSSHGLLFVFAESDTYGMWMHNMHFPIDILWLDENLQVIDVLKSVSPDTYPQIFRPQGKARYVLETEAGFSELHGIKVGDTAVWRP